MTDARKVGRVTIPTDLDVVPETLEIMKRWGADAIRDCDGTDFPAELQNQNAKIYSTYRITCGCRTCRSRHRWDRCP